MRNVHLFFRKSLSIIISLALVLPAFLLNTNTAHAAAAISNITAQVNSDGTAKISWSVDQPVSSYTAAVGNSPGAMTYGPDIPYTTRGWYSGITGNSFLATDLPTDGSVVYVKIYPAGSDSGFVSQFTAHNGTVSNPATSGSNTTGTQNDLAYVTRPDGTATVTWPAIAGANFYKLGAGVPGYEGGNKYCTSIDYGWSEYNAGNTVSLPLNNVKLPTSGGEVCIRVYPNGNTPAPAYYFPAYKADATSQTPAQTPPSTSTSGTTPPTTSNPDPSTNQTPVTNTNQAPTSTQSPNITPVSAGNFTAIWANDGGDKVTQDEQRGTKNASSVINSIWDGSKIKIFGAKNEIVNFNAILEANNSGAKDVSVVFDALNGPNGSIIKSVPTSGNGVFNWTNRDIELFYIRYLPIKGLSRLSYETYDERHIPKRFQRPWTGEGQGSGTWASRPDHDKYYPEIAVPLELKPNFNIAPNQNQSIWADIYIPKTAATGAYTGTVTVKENGVAVKQIPVELTVRNFTLPDTPSSKTMVFFSKDNVSERYTGVKWPNTGSTEDIAAKKADDLHFELAHRHKISLIDGDSSGADQPSAQWVPRLNGSLFTAQNGYRGPGEGVGNNVYSIGTYSTWGWKNEGQSGMWKHSDNWVNWFNTNAPNADHFLYLIDESSDYNQIETWAKQIESNPGPGKNLKSFATVGLPSAVSSAPALDIPASWITVGTNAWQNALSALKSKSGKQFFTYNGKRPANGSFATEDDGVALRELSWAQYKKGIDRWFFWESTYYNDYQGGRGQTNVFQNAQTFGSLSGNDSVLGETGWNHSNGDGLLFYPGTDKIFPAESYNIQGPIASLRLKHWRRGIQDVDYITMASKINPSKVNEIVNNMVPKALWDYGVSDQNDPTWVRTNISWSINPNDWENARAELASIIDGGVSTPTAPINPISEPTTTPNPAPPASSNPTTTPPVQPPAPADNGNVLLLHLNENNGATSFVDASPKGNNGVCNSTTCPTAASGKLGGAFKFDGSNDRIQVTDTNSLDLTSNFTLDAWVKPIASGAQKIVLSKRGAYYMAIHNSKLAVYVPGLKSVWYIGTKTIPLNTWSRVTVTYDGSNLKMYMNGALDRTISGLLGAAKITASPVWIGMRDDYLGNYRFKGVIDEVAIYNRALAASEIK